MKETDFAWHLTGFLSKYLPGQRNVSTNTIASYRDAFNSHSTVPGKKYLCKPYTEGDCQDSQKEAFTWFWFWVEFYLSGVWCDFQRILRTSGGGLIENFFRILLCSLLGSVVLIKVPSGEEIHPA